MSKPRTIRRPPTNAKLERLLAEIEAHPEDDAARSAAHEVIRKLCMRGLPSGLDPAVVSAVIVERMPHGAEIQRLVKNAGTEYDEAILEGVRRHRARYGVMHVLEVNLVAVLAEHGRVSFAKACERLFRAEELVGRDLSTNLPADRSPAVIERVRAAMAPWFAPEVVAHTIALAHEGMPPTAWSNAGREGATEPQGDEEWALFIACALHQSEGAAALIQSEGAAALIAARRPLVARLAEPGRSAVLDVLRHAGR